MKYYCENCDAEWDTMKIDYSRCPFCKHEGLVVEVPVRETVAQWEKRKGRKYPDTSPVYIMDYRKDHIDWHLVEFEAWRSEFANTAIVATEAGAPA
jgi:DNA-directed RNA polymerase subunit RPC12/RpoP